jgi:hypothetical protein
MTTGLIPLAPWSVDTWRQRSIERKLRMQGRVLPLPAIGAPEVSAAPTVVVPAELVAARTSDVDVVRMAACNDRHNDVILRDISKDDDMRSSRRCATVIPDYMKHAARIQIDEAIFAAIDQCRSPDDPKGIPIKAPLFSWWRMPGSRRNLIPFLLAMYCSPFGASSMIIENRRKSWTEWRHFIVWEIARSTKLTLLQIGDLLNRDHTTILHAIRKMDKRFGTNVDGVRKLNFSNGRKRELHTENVFVGLETAVMKKANIDFPYSLDALV